MHKLSLSLALFFLLIGSITAQSEVLGRWLSAEGNAQVEIYQSGDKYFGKIVWMEEPYDEDGNLKLDEENPEASLQSQTILNSIILQDFTYKNKQWKGGTIYDPESGKTYSSKMWLDGDNTLKLRGYWGFLYRTSQWTRVVD
ncbi:MAG: DUF2147 domain-containing protein [Bacteroidota bacterium]